MAATGTLFETRKLVVPKKIKTKTVIKRILLTKITRRYERLSLNSIFKESSFKILSITYILS